MKPLACLISGTIRYEKRTRYTDSALRSLGFRTVYITSDYDHIAKERFVCPVPGCIQIPVPAYRKNLSLTRIVSHWIFARQTVARLEALPEEPALVVLIVPPNFGAALMEGYHRRHPGVRVVFDLFDLWPETFPSSRSKKLLALPFRVWSGLRDRHLKTADLLLTECDLYRERIRCPGQTETVYLAEPSAASEFSLTEQTGHIGLCYLGSVNHIIDLERIETLLRALSARAAVDLYIIGDGEQLERFVKTAENAGASVQTVGACYDEAEKHRIMQKCRFGLNIMCPEVCVGLTMKSVDYFNHGLPLLNTIPADTARLIGQENAGITLISGDLQAEAERIVRMSHEECEQMRQNARHLFEAYLEESVIVDRLKTVFAKLMQTERGEG